MPVNLYEKFTKKDLLDLPDERWPNVVRSWWDSILIVPTRQKHDSGWAHIAIIGVRNDTTLNAPIAEKVLAWPDDIELPSAPLPRDLGNDIRMDCFHPRGVLRMWSHIQEFSVDMPVSSVRFLTRKRVS